jgi:tryptophan 2,3-dioxygenase
VSRADLAGPEGASLGGRAVHTPLFDLVSEDGCPMMGAPDTLPSDTLYYWDYLHLDYLLNAQTPKSAEADEVIHDEYFFIVVHQTYELWFKQILVELDSVMTIMGQARIPEKDLGTVLARLRRINAIQRLLVAQMDVLETLTPLDFLDFRSYLMPASGFQSVQFRLIENTFGLLERDRLKVEGHDYVATLREDHAELVRRSESTPSLFDHVERWLTRLPFVRRDGYDFAASYADAATEMHALARAGIEGRGDLNAEVRRKQLEAFESSVRRFDVVFDRTGWAQEVREGGRRFSHEAFMAALFISLYREDPILQVPFQILESLIDIDETLTLWRQRHALMAHRMLGRLVGSAGSGYAYLDETAQHYTPFKDLFDVSTYLLPRVDRPPLPESPLRSPVGDAW